MGGGLALASGLRYKVRELCSADYFEEDTVMERLDSGDLSPAESLALIEQQQGRVERTLEPSAVLLYGTWGAAWFLGFAVLYLSLIHI